MTAPDSATDVAAVESPNFVRILSTSKGVTDSPQMAPSVSQMISAREGGTVTNGRITLTFPAGALDQDTEITMDMLSSDRLSVELGPHGIEFNSPVVMTMDLAGTEAEGRGNRIKTVWMTDQGLVPMPMIDGGADMSACLLAHFSRYGDIDQGD